MNQTKIFAGSRLRRLRLKRGLSQSAFAESLGLSPSYLNLMERDQRPLTAQVVLRLSSMEGIDVSELAADEAAHALLQPIREMLADPLLQGEVPPGNETRELLHAAPNFAQAALKLFSAYRESLKRLADAARGAPPSTTSLQIDDWLAERRFEELEDLAEDIWSELAPKDDVLGGLKARLRSSLGIDTRILPATILGMDRARYDRHSQRLMISERLNFEDRIFETAHLLARLEGKEKLESICAASPFTADAQSMRHVKAYLTDALALMILCPRGKFSASSEELKNDVCTLARRFSISVTNAMARQAMLFDEVGFLALETTGQVTRRVGKLPFFLSKDFPLCGQLPLFDEEVNWHAATMQPLEGKSFSVLAHREGTINVALFTAPADLPKRPFGIACRLCDVAHCARRSAESTTRPAGLNNYIRGMTDYEPV